MTSQCFNVMTFLLAVIIGIAFAFPQTVVKTGLNKQIRTSKSSMAKDNNNPIVLPVNDGDKNADEFNEQLVKSFKIPANNNKNDEIESNEFPILFHQIAEADANSMNIFMGILMDELYASKESNNMDENPISIQE